MEPMSTPRWSLELWTLECLADRRLEARLTKCNKALSAARDEWQQALAMRNIFWKSLVKTDIVTENAAMSACAKGFQWRWVTPLLQESREKGLSPTVVSVSIPSTWPSTLHGLSTTGSFHLDTQAIVAYLKSCGEGRQWRLSTDFLTRWAHVLHAQPPNRLLQQLMVGHQSTWFEI
eukprot:symbB.v1.2.000289.t1/scaffold24.1/size427761/5